MRLTDNRRFKNARVWRQKERARDKRENTVNIPTGYFDMRGKPIMSGSVVLVYSLSKDTSMGVTVGVILWNRGFGGEHYCALSGCWYGDRNWTDPRNFGKIERIFDSKVGTQYSAVLVVGQLCGNRREDDATMRDFMRRFR